MSTIMNKKVRIITKCKINFRMHKRWAIIFVIKDNIPQAIYLSFKGEILLWQIIVTFLMKKEKILKIV